MNQQEKTTEELKDWLQGQGVASEPYGRGCLLIGSFGAAAAMVKAPELLSRAGVPYGVTRGGYMVTAYDIGQMAACGWKPPAAA
ncbi:MAG: hypothetical protein ACK4NR_06070 [Micavibrio sp.]